MYICWSYFLFRGCCKRCACKNFTQTKHMTLWSSQQRVLWGFTARTNCCCDGQQLLTYFLVFTTINSVNIFLLMQHPSVFETRQAVICTKLALTLFLLFHLPPTQLAKLCVLYLELSYLQKILLVRSCATTWYRKLRYINLMKLLGQSNNLCRQSCHKFVFIIFHCIFTVLLGHSCVYDILCSFIIHAR